jgi:hypothetical protein
VLLESTPGFSWNLYDDSSVPCWQPRACSEPRTYAGRSCSGSDGVGYQCRTRTARKASAEDFPRAPSLSMLNFHRSVVSFAVCSNTRLLVG